MKIPIAWQPDADTTARARLSAFLRQCGEPDFDALYARSIADVEWFTSQLLQFLEIRFDPPVERLLDLSGGAEWARWCVGGGLNISTACLAGKDPGQTAIAWEGEEGATRAWSYRALKILVQKCAAGLRDLGVGKGDAVGVYLPMMPETAAVMLAIARVGAVAVPLFTGFGPAAIADRLNDVGAKVLFTANAFPRRGRTVNAKKTADEALDRCPAVTHLVVVGRVEGHPAPMRPGRDLTWEELCERGTNGAVEPTLAEDPLLIVYTSGTTGKPKGTPGRGRPTTSSPRRCRSSTCTDSSSAPSARSGSAAVCATWAASRPRRSPPRSPTTRRCSSPCRPCTGVCSPPPRRTRPSPTPCAGRG